MYSLVIIISSKQNYKEVYVLIQCMLMRWNLTKPSCLKATSKISKFVSMLPKQKHSYVAKIIAIINSVKNGVHCRQPFRRWSTLLWSIFDMTGFM